MQGRELPIGTADALPGRARAATVVAHGVACLVHLVTAGLLTGGLWLIVVGWETIVQPLIGLVLLGFAVQLRPRLGRLDPDLPTLRRADAPALYALLDAVADTAGVRRLDAVQLGTEFAVQVHPYGFRCRRRLGLGIPLWLSLAPQQRVAAVAHALGHVAAGDIRRGALVGGALRSLSAGMEFTRPRSGTVDSIPTVSPLDRHAGELASGRWRFNRRSQAANAMLWIPGLLMTAAMRLLLRLTLPACRRTEFLADAVAARTASTSAAVGALRDRQRLAEAVHAEVHRLAVARRTFRRKSAWQSTDQDFWAEVAAHAAALPGLLLDTGKDPGHGDDVGSADPLPPAHATEPSGLPSLSSRLARLSLEAEQPATVVLDAAGVDAIENELRVPKELLARKVVQDCVTA